MKVKNRSKIAVSTVLILTIILTSCSKTAVPTTIEPSHLPDNITLSNLPAEPISLPIVEEPVELSFFSSPEPFITSKMSGYNDMQAYQEAERLTNIKIKWRQESFTDPCQKANVMFSSGQTEDIMWDAHVYASGGVQRLLSEKMIVPLNKYIDRYAPNLKKLLQDTPGLLEAISTEDGTIYMFPEIRLDRVVRANSGLCIRKDWLEKLDLEKPRTIGQWHSVLTAFKTQDPNGNGLNDEIPFVSLDRSSLNKSFSCFATAFGMIDSEDMFLKNGQISYGPCTPDYKEYLATMAQWYSEGLIDPEFCTQGSKQFDSKMLGDIGGACNGALSGTIGSYNNQRGGIGSSYDLSPVENPVSPNGIIYQDSSFYGKLAPHGASIGTNNKHLVETVKWLDWKYSDQGSTLFNWGTEGVSYTNVDGEKQFTDLILHNPDGLSLEEATAKYAGGVLVQMPTVMDIGVFRQLKNAIPQQKLASELWSRASDNMIVPPLCLDDQASKEIPQLMAEIQKYVTDMFNQFVMGIEPIENFDKFRQHLKDMEVEKVISAYQEAYDRRYRK